MHACMASCAAYPDSFRITFVHAWYHSQRTLAVADQRPRAEHRRQRREGLCVISPAGNEARQRLRPLRRLAVGPAQR